MAPKRGRFAKAESTETKKTRSSGSADQVASTSQGTGPHAAGPSSAPAPHAEQAGQNGTRRDGMAELARRRAAHFAHFQAEESDEAENAANIHTGGDEAKSLGPWSSARQLVEARADAALARKERLEGKTAERESDHHDEEMWTPSRSGWEAAPRSRPGKFLSLADRCIVTISDWIGSVDSLYGLPQTYLTNIAQAVSNRRLLTPDAFRLFTENNPSELVINNCTQINEADLSEGLAACCTFCLDKLDLRFCGRGFGDVAAEEVSKAGPLSALRVLRLAGAYRLTPESLTKVLVAAPELTHLMLPHCVRLHDLQSLRLSALLPNLTDLDLTACGGLDGAALATTLANLANLQSLNLGEVPAVDDTVLGALCTRASLLALNIQRCTNVTDAGITALAIASPALLELSLDETAVTDAALDLIVLNCSHITRLTVRGCQRIKSESPVIALAGGGRLKHLDVAEVGVVTGATLRALAVSCSRCLTELDISFCRGVAAAAVGLLLDECMFLDSVRVYGCSQLTQACIYGHSNANVTVFGEPTFFSGAGTNQVKRGGDAQQVHSNQDVEDQSDSDSVEYI